MADYGSIRTTDTLIQIGTGGSGARTLRFQNASTGNLQWNPTANRSLSLPDSDGTLMLADATNIAASIKTEPGTTYTMLLADRGRIIEFTAASPIALTLPNSFPAGWSGTIVQANSAQVQWTVQAGGTSRQADNHTRTAKQWAAVFLYVRSNTSGTNAEWVIGGYTAA